MVRSDQWVGQQAPPQATDLARKVARSCISYLEERHLYHRKDGEIVRLRDNILSAARYGLMMRRHFKTLGECVPLETAASAGWPSRGGSGRGGGGPQYARGTPNHPDGDMNPFAEM
jgi:hypothetical protein